MGSSWPWNRSERGRRSWDLPLDGTVRVRPGRDGLVVRVERGTVLVTQSGDPEDHVLEAGAELRLPPGGLVAAWALAPARLAVADGGARARRDRHGPSRALSSGAVRTWV